MRHATHLPTLDDRGTLGREQIAALGFFARYPERTARHHGYILRSYAGWLEQHGVGLLVAERAHIELWARQLEKSGRMPATVDHYLSVVTCFYRYAVIDGYVDRNPAEHVRRPKFSRDASRRIGLTPRQLATVVEAGKDLGPLEWASVSLLGIVGLRNAEACAVQIEDYSDTVQEHRVLRVVGKGRKEATIPLPHSTLRALDAAADGRRTGPLLARPWAQMKPMNGEAMRRVVARVARHAGLKRELLPHELRHSMVSGSLAAGVELHIVQEAARHGDPRTTMRYATAMRSLDRHAIHTHAANIAAWTA